MLVSSSIAALVAAGTVLAATPQGFEPASREDLQLAFCDNLAVNGLEVPQDEMEMSPVIGTGEPMPGEYAFVLIDAPCATGTQKSQSYLRMMQTGLTSSSKVSRIAFQDMFELENNNDVPAIVPFIQPNTTTSTEHIALLLNTTGCSMMLSMQDLDPNNRANFNVAEVVRKSGATVVAGSYFTGASKSQGVVSAKTAGRKGQRPIQRRNAGITVLSETPTPGSLQPTPVAGGQGQQLPPAGAKLPVILLPSGLLVPVQPVGQQNGFPGQATPVPQFGQPQPIQQLPGQQIQPIQQPGQPIQQPGQPIQQPGQVITTTTFVFAPGASPIRTTILAGQPNRQVQPGATGTLPGIILPGQPQGQPQFTLPPGVAQPTNGQLIRTPITSFTAPLAGGAAPTGTLPAILQPIGGIQAPNVVPNAGVQSPTAGQQTGGLPPNRSAGTSLRGSVVGFALFGWSTLVAALLL